MALSTGHTAASPRGHIVRPKMFVPMCRSRSTSPGRPSPCSMRCADRNFKRHSAGRREFQHFFLSPQERALRRRLPWAVHARAPRGAAWTGCAGWGRAVGGPTGGEGLGKGGFGKAGQIFTESLGVEHPSIQTTQDYLDALIREGDVVPAVGDDRWLKSPSCRRGIGRTK